MASSKPKSCSYSSTQDNQIQEDQVKQIRVKPEVEVEAEEANISKTKVLVEEATRVESKTILSVPTVARRATLLGIAPIRMMMITRNQVGQEKLHQPRRLRKKRNKKIWTSNSSNSNRRAKNLESILHQWVTKLIL